METRARCSRSFLFTSLLWLVAAGMLSASAAQGAELADRFANVEKDVTQGALRIVKDDGEVVECPLKHTDVQAEVSGFIARVTVTQTFYNPLGENIEAVYVFPLPHKAAVDDMTMVIGGRRIVGQIKRRGLARAMYELALQLGATAALLEQERPNIFTQSVGNIKPFQEVEIEISYVDVLEYDMGVYEFHFPMVVGPRYIPGGATSAIPPVPDELKGKVGELDRSRVVEGKAEPTGTGWAPDTSRVPDASRITPPVLKPGQRNGHDISLSLWLDAGVPIQDLQSPNHEAEILRHGSSQASVNIVPADSIPNKDFVLKYAVMGMEPEMAVLAHTDDAGQGYFMLMIQPQDDERLRETPPRELSFLVDVSGSMRGQPTAKVIEAMEGLLKLANPEDTVQVITFAGQSHKLFDAAVPCTPENIKQALNFTGGLKGSGGTEMLKGIKMAINDPLDPERVRIVIMLTDGKIGNEAEIIEEVGRRCGDQIRFWCIGIGQSPNRFLVDGVAKQGGGMGKVLGLNEDAMPLVQEVMFRIHRAQLAKIDIHWGNLDVFETYPARIPELWIGRPVILFGRYEGGGASDIMISGTAEGKPVSWPVFVTLPYREERHDVLAKVWARNKIEELMHQTYYAGSPEVEEAVTEIALEYRLMSQYTSFVAVDAEELDMTAEPAMPPRRMLVPVPIPEGTSYEGFFGPAEGERLSLMADRAYSTRGGGPQPGFDLFQVGKEHRPAAATIGGYVAFEAQASALGRPPVMGNLFRSHRPMAVGAPAQPSQYGYMGARLEEARRARAAVKGLGYFDVDGDGITMGDEMGVVSRMVVERTEETAKRATAALENAAKLKEEGKLLEARAAYGLAYLLDSSLAAYGRSDGSTSTKALEAIEEINKELVAGWSKELPGLEKRIDLVIRNKSVAEALAAVAKAAGIEIRLIPGSVEDAAAITRRKDVRVTYLDLRNATAAQALDWILVPERMTWWVAKGKVMAGTVRRSGDKSPWVYDVSLAALPLPGELEKIEEPERRFAAAKKDAEDFLKAAQKQLGLGSDEMAWYGPGEVLLFAGAEAHERAAKLFGDLADPEAKVEGALAGLHEVTSKRAEQRKETAAKLLAQAEQMRVAQTMYEYGWRLLAEAAAGRLDLEALTELQAAWARPEAGELLEGKGTLIAIRSMWALAEAAKALPEEKELAALAESTASKCRQASADALEELGKSPEDAAAYLKVAYAALAGNRDGDYMEKARPLLVKERAKEWVLAGAPAVMAALLSPAEEADVEALIEVVSTGVQGEDMVVLTALACRRADGDAWKTFREEARMMLGDQPLSGGVVVLVNRLSRPELKLASAIK